MVTWEQGTDVLRFIKEEIAAYPTPIQLAVMRQKGAAQDRSAARAVL